MLKGFIVHSLWSPQQKITVSDNNLEGAEAVSYLGLHHFVLNLETAVPGGIPQSRKDFKQQGFSTHSPQSPWSKKVPLKREAVFHPLCQSYCINHHGPLPGFGSPRPDFQRDQAPKVPAELSSSGNKLTIADQTKLYPSSEKKLITFSFNFGFSKRKTI